VTEASALAARVDGFAGKLRIDVDLRTHGGPLVLVGPNGAGKTSLLMMILGALRPERGRIEIGDSVLFDGAAGVDVPLEQRRLGYVPQHYALFPHLTVRQNVEFAVASSPGAAGPDARRARVDDALRDLELQALGDRRAGALSGGEKQRVALARALAASPRALLLDEPLAALDAHARREVRLFLAGCLQRLGLPTLVVTHDAADARLLGERIAVLENGRIVQTGSWPELEAQPASPFVAEFLAAGR
jgi:molybdate transport system ATP-binding protein